MTTTTGIDEFREKVDLYSADLSRWPQELVKPALEFMRENPVAQAYFDHAAKLDAALRAYEPEPAALPALEARIMQAVAGAAPVSRRQAETAQTEKAPVWQMKWLFAPTGGLLAAAILGFFLGFNPQQAQNFAPLDPAYMAEEQLAQVDTDIDEEVF